MFVDESVHGPWNSIDCVIQPTAMAARIVHPTPDAARGVAGNLSDTAATLAALAAPDAKVLAAAAAAGLDSDQARNLQALMRVESSGCVNNESAVGALGCMQIMPDTARQYNPSLRNKTDAEVRAWLLDEDNNIALGAEIYADLDDAFGGNETKIHAAYNGGWEQRYLVKIVLV